MATIATMSHTVSQLVGWRSRAMLTISMTLRGRRLVLITDLVEHGHQDEQDSHHEGNSYPIRKIPGDNRLFSHMPESIS